MPVHTPLLDMEPIPFEELDVLAPAFDADVERAPLPDRFCSSSDWILPAVRAFAPEAESAVLRFDEGWAALMTIRTVLGRTLMPLEASWGLASPFVGLEPAEVAARFLTVALARRDRWDAMFLSGLVRGDATFQRLVRRLGRSRRLGLGQSTVRCVASLEGGIDGFLSRRSPKFRKNLRRAVRSSAGLRIEVLRPGPEEAGDVLRRILDVERRSWKAAEGHGIETGPMRAFYEAMVPRLARRGALRVTLAWDEEERPVGYVLGGLRADLYRGLQISFDDRLADLGLGNRLQLATIEDLCAEGIAWYDLGTDMPYKRRWAERRVETVPLVVR